MSSSAPVAKVTRLASWLAAVILLLVPFHALLTVWLAGASGHYTLWRLWKEFLLIPIVLAAVYLLAVRAELRRRFFSLWITRLIVIYSLLLIVMGLVGLARNWVSAKAMWYGLLVDLRFLIFFLAVLTLAGCSGWLTGRWPRLLFVPAILVAAVAILQYLVLPYDFLKHFGYNQSTIFPYETINHNLNHIRVMSTLRGANPLGAYLLVPISGAVVMYLAQKAQRTNIGIFGIGMLLALMFSFSRSAWIGVVLAVAVAVWLSVRAAGPRKILLWSATGLAVIAVALGVLLRNNLEFENAILHTDRQSTAVTSSNEGHIAAFRLASSDVIHQPLGGGVGSAGPQSIYNDHQARIAENYFLQIGQEAGLLGMALFIAICLTLGKLLFERRADPLALALLAALIGLTFVNLLSHAWEDDTLAYVFWGLAAIACAPVIMMDKLKVKNGQKEKP